MIAAVFFPHNPHASSFDLQAIAVASIKAGLQLYTNGRQMALLPRPMAGWSQIAN